MLEIYRRSERRLELAPIRLEDRRPAIGEEILVLGIHHSRHFARLRVVHERGYQGGSQNALVVVLEDKRIGGVDGVDAGRQKALDLDAPDIRIVLFIEADDLLGAREDARLGGGAALDRHDGPRIRADLAQHFLDYLALGVVADRADESALRSDGGDVLRDVGGAAQRQLLLADAHHRHRRFGRYPVDIPAQVNVEH